jgi:hypothetical protein
MHCTFTAYLTPAVNKGHQIAFCQLLLSVILVWLQGLNVFLVVFRGVAGIQTDLINLLDLRRLHADASPEKSDCSDEEDENDKVDGDAEETEKDGDEPFISNSVLLEYNLVENSSFQLLFA